MSASTSPSTDAPAGPPSTWMRHRRLVLFVLDQGVVSATSFAANFMVGRFASEVQYAHFTLALNLMQVHYLLSGAFVFSPLLAQFHLQGRGRSVVPQLATRMLVITSGFGVVAVLATLGGVGGEAFGTTIAICLGAAAIPVLFRELTRQVLFLEERVERALWLDATSLVIELALLAVLRLSVGVSGGVALLVLGAANLVALLLIRPRVGSELAALGRSWAATREDWGFSVGLLLTGLTLFVGGRAVPWLVEAVLSTRDVARLGAAQLLAGLLQPLATALSNEMGPRFSRVVGTRGATALSREVWRTSLQRLFILSLCAVPLALFGQPALDILMKHKFQGLESVIAVLALNFVVVGVSSPFSTGLIALERSLPRVVCSAISACITPVAVVLLASRYGLTGAVAGVTLSMVVLTVCEAGAFERECRRRARTELAQGGA